MKIFLLLMVQALIMAGCSEKSIDKPANFDFVLKYGPGQKNEINTFDQKLVLQLNYNKVVTQSDFQLPESDMHEIYKEMEKVDILGEKNLSKTCEEKPFLTYYLKVRINDVYRTYRWTSCSVTEDDENMIRIAQLIKKKALQKLN